MTSSEYKNTIEWTLSVQTQENEDTLTTAKRILTNLGVPFPHGTLEEAVQILSTRNYMGWNPCNAAQAKYCANHGYAAIGVTKNSVVIILPEDEAVTVENALPKVSHPAARKLSELQEEETADMLYFVYAILLEDLESTQSDEAGNIRVAAAATTTCSSCQGCNACQYVCERSCQTCNAGCQSCNTCQGCNTCQDNCQVSCQTCNVGCQSCNTCNSCQTGCQTNNHTWGEWTVVKAATCKSTGIMRRVCKSCSASEEKTIAINPDAHSWGTTIVYNKTHPHKGARTCKLCGIQNPNDSYAYTGSYPGCSFCTTLPAPSNLHIETINYHAITLSWSKVANASGYRIYLNENQKASTTNTFITMNDLTPATEYKIYVKAYNSSAVSGNSVTLTYKSHLPDPTNVSVSSIRKTTARISWNAVSGTAGYRLYLNDNQIYNGTNTSYNLTGLTAGTRYRYAIQAYNSSGFTSIKTEKEFTTIVNKPNKPTASNISYNFVSDGASVTLSWSAVPGAAGYHLLMDGNIKYSGENLSYTMTVPSSKSPHKFRVMAYNDAGVSEESDYCDVSVTYNSQSYNAELAKKCAEYALLAYDDIKLNSNNRYYNVKKRDDDPKPTVLLDKLQTDGYSNSEYKNYGDDEEHNVSYVLAKKSILFNSTNRTLVAVIIRGTDGVEWKGNMDVTNTSYDPIMNEHYSFKQAEENLNAGLTNYLSGISNPVYLITGHSRGAAVANLLAETLSSKVGASNVFAYTFATPNNVKTSIANTARTNIYNFCFNDDFVPQVPLTGWGYSKHGITFVKTAGDLYNSNVSFKNDLDVYAADSNRKSVSFNLSGTNGLISYVKEIWNDVHAFYQDKYTYDSSNISMTLYSFFRNVVALAAMGENAGIAELLYTSTYYSMFSPISVFFVDGSGFKDYIYFGHHAFTYYTALRYGLF